MAKTGFERQTSIAWLRKVCASRTTSLLPRNAFPAGWVSTAVVMPIPMMFMVKCLHQTSCYSWRQQFSQHGYQTTLSNHLNMSVTPELAGFQMRTSTPPTTQGTAQEFFWHAGNSGKSFFVHFSFGLVHRPFGQEFDAERVPTLPVPEVLPDTIITRWDLATLVSQVEQLDTAVGWILSASSSQQTTAWPWPDISTRCMTEDSEPRCYYEIPLKFRRV